ncbi:MAG: 2-oxoglutarate dehydrogenase complex dihydrolipoyllysine-residue succinyltransferase [Verrucomicrobiales bacterium]
MAHEIKIPSVGESITSATLGAWHKDEGDYVKSGEIILTIETDKISTELEADRDGILHRLAAEGDELDIGAAVASIEEGEAPGDGGGEVGKDESDSEAAPTEGAPTEAAPTEAAPTSGEASAEKAATEEDVKATPVAKKIAADEGIDLASLSGSGAGGKVTKADVVAAASSPASGDEDASSRESAESSGSEKTRGGRTSRRKLSPLRRNIAARLVNAQHEAAILTTFNECDMSEIMSLRKRVQDDFVKRHDVKLGFMSFFIKAAVEALKAVPAVNAQIDGDEIVENHFYDIGVAVGTEKGLFVPVIRDCDGKSFAEIERDIVEYAAKARKGSITLDDLQGGVFTITNGGIYGSLLSTPILNPPQSGILGMHTIQQRPMALDGEVVIRPMMYLALSYDHRLVDGKEAVTFLVRLKECIEHPERLLVGV